jgi:hypothetical protein
MCTEITNCKHGALIVECPICQSALLKEIAALREENERLELELSEAQCQVKLWAFKGHAPWCEVQNNGDKCHCGHAETMDDIPKPEDR